MKLGALVIALMAYACIMVQATFLFRVSPIALYSAEALVFWIVALAIADIVGFVVYINLADASAQK